MSKPNVDAGKSLHYVWEALFVACFLGVFIAHEFLGSAVKDSLVWFSIIVWMFSCSWVFHQKSLRGVLTSGFSTYALFGVLLLVPAFASMLELVANVERRAILIVIAVIFATDTGAYFVGKAVGKRRLFVEVSPNKTVEGLIGGLVAAGLIYVVCWWVFRPLVPGLDYLWFVPLVLYLAVMGDLFISSVKRSQEAKDSSALLPGHGGLLDRADSILPVVSLSALVIAR